MLNGFDPHDQPRHVPLRHRSGNDARGGAPVLVNRRYDDNATLAVYAGSTVFHGDGTKVVFFSNAVELFDAPYVLPFEVLAPMVCDTP